MQLYLGEIRSKTALLETAKLLRQMADGFEVQANILEGRRNYVGIGKHDISPTAKALKFIKSHPNFPDLTASECRKICDRFSLDYLPAAEILMNSQTILRRERRAERDELIKKMKLRKVKSKDIARRFGLSEARVSEITRKA